MNALRKAIHDLRLTDLEAMNALKDNGIVSDNAVNVEDVAEADVDIAARFLRVEILMGLLKVGPSKNNP